jgi:hypothetical protein
VHRNNLCCLLLSISFIPMSDSSGVERQSFELGAGIPRTPALSRSRALGVA